MAGELVVTQDEVLNLKALAEKELLTPGAWFSAHYLDAELGFDWTTAQFIAAANPHAVLGLIRQRDDLLTSVRFLLNVIRDYGEDYLDADDAARVAEIRAVIARVEGRE